MERKVILVLESPYDKLISIAIVWKCKVISDATDADLIEEAKKDLAFLYREMKIKSVYVEF